MELEYESDNINTEINFARLEWKLDEQLEMIFEDVIIPYIHDCTSQEILHNLNEFNYSKFISFFKEKSVYCKYIMDNLK